MGFSRLKKQSIMWWSSVILETFMKNSDKRVLLVNLKLKVLFDKSAVPLITCTTKTSFTETLRPKILLFTIKLSKYVILDGQVKDITQENHYVEHLHIFLLKLSKTNSTTRKSMSGAWECWPFNLFSAESHSKSRPNKTWEK